MRVEIWSDIACPWCYVGKARFEKALAAFPHRDQVEVVHRSFELDPGRAKDDVQPVIAMLTRKYGMSEAQAEAGEDNLGAQAAAEGLPYRTRGRDHGSTFDMHRLLHFARERGRQTELLDLLYRANFAEERSVFDDDGRLVELAGAAGLDADAAREVLADPTAYADEVRADEREAARLGANGVPFFVLDRAYGVSGAQPAEVFTRALTQAWQARAPLAMVQGGPAAGDGGDGGDACGPDGCAVPGPGEHDGRGTAGAAQ
ncbi:DsbA family oxidoreductase [Streptomyces sp. NPDC090994]|uniref:DsbA family oxidoreductase n=1 Tax=Streptomyces sp. NPDC090994 TaxID=3365969 RepID=UPI00380DE95A